ncbi:hypothetical protein [Pantanalinema sp. GBBB05]|uniref:hypothetical protein n=1 Tax=Pantanalinema sp. GBBB05 TaxID=2604139 RepID=UPI003D81A934
MVTSAQTPIAKAKQAPKSFVPLSKIWRYLGKTSQCLIENPSLFFMRKLARFEIVRNLVYQWHKTFAPPQPISITASHLQNFDVNQVVSAIATDGYYAGLQLSQSVVQELLDYAYSTPCYGDRNPNLKFYIHERAAIEAKLGRSLQGASYLNDLCPTLKALIEDPGLLAIAAQFLGATPAYVASEVMWSFPRAATWVEQLKMAQVFHYDIDDYRSIKFFFYLTDVNELNGPHVCLKGTHKHKKFLHQLIGQRCASIADEQLAQEYGAENVRVLCGKAGFGFAEDTCCFHKGTLPRQGSRLMLQIEYAINSYGNIRAY